MNNLQINDIVFFRFNQKKIGEGKIIEIIGNDKYKVKWLEDGSWGLWHKDFLTFSHRIKMPEYLKNEI